MKAIILAAGRGSRMKNLTEENPKCLVTVHGKALLEWQLIALRSAGISDIAVVTGYKRELLSNRGLVEFHNERWSKTNMVNSLACAAEWLDVEPCVVSYSDIFYDAPAIKALMNCQASLAITYDPNWRQLWEKRFKNPLVDAETFRMNADGTLAEIGNTPRSISEIEGQYMGLLRFTPRGWSEVVRLRSELTPEQCDQMHMTGTLQKVLDAGRVPVVALPYVGKWGEIDSIDDLDLYNSAAG